VSIGVDASAHAEGYCASKQVAFCSTMSERNDRPTLRLVDAEPGSTDEYDRSCALWAVWLPAAWPRHAGLPGMRRRLP
jgi:hypothetical protein